MTNEARKKWEAVLARHSKADLIACIIELASSSLSIRNAIATRFEVDESAEDLLAQTRSAIAAATDFDERDRNSNFDYDSEAYNIIKKNFAKLLNLGKTTEVMKLAFELMRSGSYQVECSDEGMMSAEIENCIKPVITALGKSDLEPSLVREWCNQMLKVDRVQFICTDELHALKEKTSRS